MWYSNYKEIKNKKILGVIKMRTLKEVKERLEEIVKYGANNGSVSFCIYTEDNNNIIKDYLSEVFDYINEQRDNYNIILENGDEVVFSVIDNFCYDISNYIDDNMEDENENEENINALLNYIKNEYNYFGEFDRVIIDKLMEELLED